MAALPPLQALWAVPVRGVCEADHISSRSLPLKHGENIGQKVNNFMENEPLYDQFVLQLKMLSSYHKTILVQLKKYHIVQELHCGYYYL